MFSTRMRADWVLPTCVCDVSTGRGGVVSGAWAREMGRATDLE
jgi:hypothetical protein